MPKDNNVVERLQKLLGQKPIVDWGDFNQYRLSDFPQDEHETVLAEIISKNPPYTKIEVWFKDWANNKTSTKGRGWGNWAKGRGNKTSTKEGGWSNIIFQALAIPFVNCKIMRVYFEIITEADRNLKVDWGRCNPVARRLTPSKLQCLITFLYSYYPTRCVNDWVLSLLEGSDLYGETRSSLWDNHNQESWARLNAIVRGVDISGSTPFLEKYVRILMQTGTYSALTMRTLSWQGGCKCTDHLKLVAKFAPHLFMERNEASGDTFLNYTLRTFGDDVDCAGFTQQVLDSCVEAVYVPNNRGETPFDYCLKSVTRGEDVGLCYCSHIFAKTHFLGGVVLVGDSIKSPPFIQIVKGLVDVLAGYENKDLMVCGMFCIVKVVDAFLKHVTDDCCNNVFDHNGDTALHVAIRKSRFILSQPCRLGQSARRLLLRLMTRQAALSRNALWELPIDLNKSSLFQPWISVAISKIAPEVLEIRNKHKLYPFQVMAYFSHNDERLSVCYTLLRMAPHLVSTALTEKNTAYLSSEHFIEASKLRLKVGRDWITGMHKVKELERMAIEEQKRKQPP